MVKTNNFKSRKDGSALLSALFIMTLVAIAATAMTLRLQMDIYRARILINNDQRYLSSQAVTFWAMSQLMSKKYLWYPADKNGWVSKFPNQYKNMVDNTIIEGGLIDLQSKININSVGNNKAAAVFYRLLKIKLPGLTDKERYSIITNIRYWTSKYNPQKENTNIISQYSNQNPPYYPSHQNMVSVSELRLINGINAKSFIILEPYLTALPEGTKINISTATPDILMSLSGKLTMDKVKALIKERSRLKNNKMSSYQSIIKKYDLPINILTTESNYFLAISKVTYQKYTLINYALLKRVVKRSRNNKNKIKVHLIHQTLNYI